MAAILNCHRPSGSQCCIRMGPINASLHRRETGPDATLQPVFEPSRQSVPCCGNERVFQRLCPAAAGTADDGVAVAARDDWIMASLGCVVLSKAHIEHGAVVRPCLNGDHQTNEGFIVRVLLADRERIVGFDFQVSHLTIVV
jgi:hypothetical protein